MIAGSVANNVGFNARQLHLIPVEKCADCRFAGFRLQVVTPSVAQTILCATKEPFLVDLVCVSSMWQKLQLCAHYPK